MAYAGYYLKINNTTFPQAYIKKGTYKGTTEKRIVEKWTDAAQVEHVEYSGTKKADITLSLIEHNSDEHGAIAAFFQTVDNISVSYFDDDSNDYRTATCRLEKIQWPRLSSYGGKIQYGSAKIHLIEN